MATLITYDGRVAAFAGGRIRHLVPPFDDLAEDDPRRRMVVLMCAFAIACADRALPGPYSDERAARFARTILIDDGEFIARLDEDDELLAERFGVPIEEVARKRDDLKRWVAPLDGDVAGAGA